jgi:hypothetical protein
MLPVVERIVPIESEKTFLTQSQQSHPILSLAQTKTLVTLLTLCETHSFVDSGCSTETEEGPEQRGGPPSYCVWTISSVMR